MQAQNVQLETERYLQLLRAQELLQEERQEVEFKNQLIAHLEKQLKDLKNQETFIHSPEVEVQCEQLENQLLEREVKIERLERMLQDKEQIQQQLSMVENRLEERLIVLQTEGQQKDGEISQLGRRLQEKQVQMIQMREQQERMHAEMVRAVKQSSMKQRQIKDLQLRFQKLSEQLDNKQKEEKNSMKKLLQQEKIIEEERLKNSQANEKIVEMQQLISHLQQIKHHLQDEIVTVSQEVQKLKNIINGNEWRMFCLETEVDLGIKEKNQFKTEWEKTELQLAQSETFIKEQRTKIYAFEEDVKELEIQNQQLKDETKQLKTQNNGLKEKLSQQRVFFEELNEQMSQLKEYNNYLKRENRQELEQTIKEKDDKILELTKYLKEKIRYHDSYKLMVTQQTVELEHLKEILQNSELKNYQLEQTITEQEAITEKQQEQLQTLKTLKEKQQEIMKQLEGNIHSLQKKISGDSLMIILKKQDWEEQISCLSYALIEKEKQLKTIHTDLNSKCQELKSELEETRHKLIECLTYKSTFDELYMLLEEKEIKLTSEKNEKQVAEKKVEQLALEVSQLKQENEEFERETHFLMEEIRTLRENFEIFKGQSDRKVCKLEEEISNLEEDMLFEKEKALAHIKIEANYAYQINELNQHIMNASLENHQLMEKQKQLKYKVETLNTSLVQLQREKTFLRQANKGLIEQQESLVLLQLQQKEKINELIAIRNIKEKEVNSLKKDVKRLHLLSQTQVQEINSFLTHKNESSFSVSSEEHGDAQLEVCSEDTTAFEILGEDETSKINELEQQKEELERQKLQIIQKMDSYLNEITQISAKHVQS